MMVDVQRLLSLNSVLEEAQKFLPCLRWVQVMHIYLYIEIEVLLLPCSMLEVIVIYAIMVKASEEH